MRSEQHEERRDPEGRGAPRIRTFDSEPLAPDFYARPAEDVARDLLGMYLVSTVDDFEVVGRIVETEAYVGPEDEASHAAARIGRTHRNDPMFGPPGIAYIYRIYGVHWCLNAVTDTPDHPAAVLIRAAAIVDGAEAAKTRRGDRPLHELMRGPGNLCRALGITGSLNFHRLDRSPLCIVQGRPVARRLVERGPRIGITRAAHLPLRFWVRSDPAVSRHR